MQSGKNDNLRTALGMARAHQDALNQRLYPDWKDRGFNFPLAIVFESIEALGHTNWSWWKTKTYKQALSPAQIGEIHVELCDILHFGLSVSILEHGQGLLADDYIAAFEDADRVACDFQADMEALVVDALLLRSFNVKKFARACRAVGLSLTELLAYYFAKAELNSLRWANGYSEGKYIKMWDLGDGPKEDNTHLIGFLHLFTSARSEQDLARAIAGTEFAGSVYGWLKETYEWVVLDNRPHKIA